MKKTIIKGKKCSKCGTVLEREEYIELCDWCGKEVENSLHVVVFYEGNNADRDEDFYFHSWKCVREWMLANKAKIAECSFVSLPYVVPGLDKEGMAFFEDFVKEGGGK